MEFGGYFRFVIALIFVLGLIGLLAMLARRMGFGFPAPAIKASKDRRIGIVEAAQLDGRRRLVLVRRDDVEHLVLLSPNSELLIESGIPAGRARFSDTLEDVRKAAAVEPDDVGMK